MDSFRKTYLHHLKR